MILRSIMTFFFLLLLVLVENGFVSALPGVLSSLPLVFISGVLLYHFVKPSIGSAWLIIGGLIFDLVGLPGLPQTVSYTLAALIGLLLAKRVFTTHSLYAMMGLGASMFAISLMAETIWLLASYAVSDYQLPLHALSEQFWIRWLTFNLSLLGAFIISRRFSVFIKRQFLLRQ